MIKAPQDEMLHLSSKFSKMLKSRFGKGPETCYVVLKENKLYIYISNFITPAEEVLVGSGKVDLATHFRYAVIDAIYGEFIPEASKVLGVAFDTYFHDWNYNTNKGILIVENSKAKPTPKIDVLFEKDLIRLIERVSSKLQKIPDLFKIVKFNSNICTIECKGVMLPIDRLLYEKGSTNLLLERSRQIKNGFLEHKPLFEETFNRMIEELFIVWDYDTDRSLIVFNFN